MGIKVKCVYKGIGMNIGYPCPSVDVVGKGTERDRVGKRTHVKRMATHARGKASKQRGATMKY